MSSTDILDPISISYRFEHDFERNPLKVGKGPIKWTEKCEVCGGKPDEPYHAGYPPSLNAFLNSSGARFRYRFVKQVWGEKMLELAVKAELVPCKSVRVTGLVIFPDQITRDQGNYRFFIEKCLGDAVEKVGVLKNDSWDYYTFADLDYRYEKDARGLELQLEVVPDYAAMAEMISIGSGT